MGGRERTSGRGDEGVGVMAKLALISFRWHFFCCIFWRHFFLLSRYFSFFGAARAPGFENPMVPNFFSFAYIFCVYNFLISLYSYFLRDF
jgi:hypothetical protein